MRTSRTTGWRGALEALGNPNFRLFLIGMFCSSTGVWTQRIAQDWLVLELTNSPTQVGITTMLQYLPMLLFGLIGGLAADRYSRRRILIGTQIGMMLLSITLAALTLSHEVRPWQVFTVAFLVGTVFAFDIPARQSFVNELVADGQVRNAIGLTATVFQIGALIGPAASGALIGAVGPGYAFATTAVMYLVPMTALLRMDLRGVEPGERPPGPMRLLHELREGLRYVAHRPEIVWTIVLVGTFGTFVSNLPVTNAAFARLVFHNGAGGYGLLGSVGAVGSVLGALFAATRHRRPRLASNLAAGALLAALYVVASIVPGLVGYAIVLVAIGAMTITFMTSCNSTIQISADLHVRGRVMGLYNLVFIGGGAAGGPLIGAVDQYAGPRIGMLVSGAIPALITVIVAIRLRRTLGVRVRLNRRKRVVAAPAVPPVDASSPRVLSDHPSVLAVPPVPTVPSEPAVASAPTVPAVASAPPVSTVPSEPAVACVPSEPAVACAPTVPAVASAPPVSTVPAEPAVACAPTVPADEPSSPTVLADQPSLPTVPPDEPSSPTVPPDRPSLPTVPADEPAAVAPIAAPVEPPDPLIALDQPCCCAGRRCGFAD